jgi:hypothetical protein
MGVGRYPMCLDRTAAPTPLRLDGLHPLVLFPEGVFQLRRLVLAVVAATALLLPSGALAHDPTTTVEPFPADFTLSSETCPNLPEGTVIEGTGTGKSVTKTTTNRDGTTTVFNSTIAPGKATDQDGNRYRFLYSNQFEVSNTTANPNLFSGFMVDLFLLRGNGPAKLTNGFLARFTTDFGELAELDPIFEFGDPLDFETGAAKCDPL